MIIKIGALSPKVYAHNLMNLFDGFITILALLDISKFKISSSNLLRIQFQLSEGLESVKNCKAD